jgi:hypothetical protein
VAANLIEIRGEDVGLEDMTALTSGMLSTRVDFVLEGEMILLFRDSSDFSRTFIYISWGARGS